MKIQRIKLESFRSYAALEIELPKRITVLRGPNHAGKSTIEQAIQYALAARSEGTNAAGAGADETLIRHAADIARIYLDLEVDGEQKKLRATLSRKTGRAIATRDADGVDTTHLMNPFLRDNADVLSCLTNSRYFVDLKPADQKDILSRIVLPQTYDGWDKEMITACERVGIPTGAFTSTHPFTVIGKAYDEAFEMRKNVNRDLKNFVVPNADVADAGDVEEVKSKLKERRDQLTTAQTRRATMLAGVVSPEIVAQRRKTTEERIARAERKLAEETRTLTEHQVKVLDKKALKANQTLAAQGKLAGELDAQIATLEIEKKTCKVAIDRADALSDQCPTCAQAITDETKMLIAKPLIDRMNAIGDELKPLRKQRESIGDFALAATALREHEMAEKEVTRTTERLNEAKADLAGANADLEAIGEAQAVDTGEVDAEIADLTQRIEKGTTILTRVTAANERKIAYDAAVVKMNALKETSALLESLVAYFGPSGIQASLLQVHVGAFTASMNEVLSAWGYECALSFAPEFFFGVVTTVADSDIRRVWPLKTLSKSERYRFAIAFQVALAMHTGFRFVVIDEMDMLDSAGRGGLMQQIIASGLDQAILIGTDERASITPGMAEAADFFMVQSSLADGIPTSSVNRIKAAI